MLVAAMLLFRQIKVARFKETGHTPLSERIALMND
jgi:hypothetical protein